MENVELMEGLEILSVSAARPMAMNVVLISLTLVVLVVSTYLVASAVLEGSLGGVIFGLFFYCR